MSLCQDGLNTKTKGGRVITIIEDSDPLIQLANLIDWNHLAALAQPDLERTRKRLWWPGRKLRLKIHLAVMILQMVFKWTDRLTKARIMTTPLYQIFCGINILVRWRCPDHTKIEKFRNRLSPKTDKGYYSHYNVKFVETMTGNADGVQRPENVKNWVEALQKEKLCNRRAGVKLLIGRAKRFRLGKNRMFLS